MYITNMITPADNQSVNEKTENVFIDSGEILLVNNKTAITHN